MKKIALFCFILTFGGLNAFGFRGDGNPIEVLDELLRTGEGRRGSFNSRYKSIDGFYRYVAKPIADQKAKIMEIPVGSRSRKQQEQLRKLDKRRVQAYKDFSKRLGKKKINLVIRNGARLDKQKLQTLYQRVDMLEKALGESVYTINLGATFNISRMESRPAPQLHGYEYAPVSASEYRPVEPARTHHEPARTHHEPARTHHEYAPALRQEIPHDIARLLQVHPLYLSAPDGERVANYLFEVAKPPMFKPPMFKPQRGVTQGAASEYLNSPIDPYRVQSVFKKIISYGGDWGKQFASVVQKAAWYNDTNLFRGSPLATLPTSKEGRHQVASIIFWVGRQESRTEIASMLKGIGKAYQNYERGIPGRLIELEELLPNHRLPDWYETLLWAHRLSDVRQRLALFDKLRTLTSQQRTSIADMLVMISEMHGEKAAAVIKDLAAAYHNKNIGQMTASLIALEEHLSGPGLQDEVFPQWYERLLRTHRLIPVDRVIHLMRSSPSRLTKSERSVMGDYFAGIYDGVDPEQQKDIDNLRLGYFEGDTLKVETAFDRLHTITMRLVVRKNRGVHQYWYNALRKALLDSQWYNDYLERVGRRIVRV